VFKTLNKIKYSQRVSVHLNVALCRQSDERAVIWRPWSHLFTGNTSAALK